MTANIAPAPTPGVLLWFKIYTGILAFIYFACSGFSLFFFLGDPKELDMPTAIARVVGILVLLGCWVFAAACLLPLLLRPRPWLWVYNLIVICLGMTSACFLPFCIPLLIFWIKPETRIYFGKR